MKGLARTDAGYLFFNLAGQGISALVMLPATFCAGMTLPLITGALLRRGAGERAIGQVYAANTLGAIAGVLLAVHLGLPLLGTEGHADRSARWSTPPSASLLLYRFAPRRRRVRRVAAAACAARLRAGRAAVRTECQQDDRRRVPARRPVQLARTRSILFNEGRQDRDRAPGALWRRRPASAPTASPTARSTWIRDGARGSDEITMVLTGALPLALKPDAKSAAVIGIGTGLTMHTLLQSLSLERVETVEIEAAMAEAARGFAPRNSSAFADPRGSDRDRRRQDLLLHAQPALRHPGLRALQSLGERRLEPVHARVLPAHPRPPEPGRHPGAVVPALRDRRLAARLGDARAGRGVPALRGVRAQRPRPADRRLGRARCRCRPKAAVFEQPTLAQELRNVHVLTPGRPRRALPRRPRHAGAAVRELRHAGEFGLLPGARPERGAAPLHGEKRHRRGGAAQRRRAGAGHARARPAAPRRSIRCTRAPSTSSASRTRASRAMRAISCCSRSRPSPKASRTLLQKDLELAKLRLIECREPRDQDVWLHSLLNVARTRESRTSPPDEAAAGLGALHGRALLRRRCATSSGAGSRCSPRSARATAARSAALAARTARQRRRT